MGSRDEILRSVRSHLPQSAPLPELRGDWIVYGDPRQQFATVLESVGGRCVVVNDLAELNAGLAAVPEHAQAARCCSLLPGVGKSNVDLNAIDDPHALEDVDYAILRGHFAVAENAAVWVTDAGMRQRVLYFLPQHLALVVPYEAVLNNMHEAYARLAGMRFFTAARPDFGAFISGPSKTADIEQSLVIGAHGARSLTVFLLKAGADGAPQI